MSMSRALNRALHDALAADDRVYLLGEDIGALGGVFRVTDGLARRFGESRVSDTPLAEAGILGTAVGLAIRGYRPVVEIQFDGFVYPAYDQIVCQVAKMHYRSQGKVKIPMVIRIPFGGGIGAVEHHSESPETLFAHVAGLKVVACGDPVDAYWMIQQAIKSDDPVIFFEPKRRYHEKAELDETTGPARPLYQAKVVREGTDATLFCYGPMVKTCLQAAEAAVEDGRNLEVVDLRSIAPLDLATIFASVKKTRRALVVHEAPLSLGTGSELAARVSEECFYHLEAPVLRVTGYDTPYPPSRMEEEYLPDLGRVLDGVDRVMEY